MSIQRRRGQKVTIWPETVTTDSRGNQTIAPDPDNPITTTAAFIPQRGSKAEVPGQVEIEVYTMILRNNVEGLGLWSRVLWQGAQWDIAAPPSYHFGSRHVRHASVDIRRRPDG